MSTFDDAAVMHQIIEDAAPENRDAVAALLDLPLDYRVGTLTGNGRVIGDLQPLHVLLALRQGSITGDVVMRHLDKLGVLRPADTDGVA